MLESLTLKDFNNHKLTKVEFHPQVTSIVGPNDAGKTSIIQALGLVCFNEPSGIGYIRGISSSGETKRTAKVTLRVDGQTIRRVRGKSSNAYKLNDKVYVAFGADVPDAIRDLLNVDPINFQYQLDRHFWFSDTAGHVSKQINRIVNLELIDSVLSDASSRVKHCRSVQEVGRGRLEAAEVQEKETRWIITAAKEYEEVAASKKEVDDLDAEIRTLERLYAPAKKLEVNIRRWTTMLSEVEDAVTLGEQALKLRKEEQELRKLLKIAEQAELAANAEVPDLSEALRIRKKGDQIAEDVSTLEAALEEATKLEETLCELESEMAKTLKAIKKSGKGLCPLCQTPIQNGSSQPSPTFTSATKHQCLDQKKKSGSKPSSSKSRRSGNSATTNPVPW